MERLLLMPFAAALKSMLYKRKLQVFLYRIIAESPEEKDRILRHSKRQAMYVPFRYWIEDCKAQFDKYGLL